MDDLNNQNGLLSERVNELEQALADCKHRIVYYEGQLGGIVHENTELIINNER